MTSWEKHQRIRNKKTKYVLPETEGVEILTPNIEITPIKTKKIEKREEKIMIDLPFAPEILITQEEHEKLKEEYGDDVAKEYIRKVNNYILKIGKNKYHNHYAAVVDFYMRDHPAIKKEVKKKSLPEMIFVDEPD